MVHHKESPEKRLNETSRVEAFSDGVFAMGEFGEAVQAELDVVLGLDLELLGDEGGFEVVVVFVSGGGEEVFGLVLGEVGGFQEIVELGGLGVGEVGVEGGEVGSRRPGCGRGVGSARAGGLFERVIYRRRWGGDGHGGPPGGRGLGKTRPS